ncbi:zinc ribbon domain-containing protein [Candidatus Bathyarchaeota archaeon]|nr:zinc ribbon domain-containing protein [Candidatus Bathyarchaeota archaeon]
MSILVAAVAIAVYLLLLRMRWENVKKTKIGRAEQEIRVRLIDTSRPESAGHRERPTEAQDRYCSFCGEKIEVESKYCDRCGVEQWRLDSSRRAQLKSSSLV